MKNILIGVTGGISAYKSANIVSGLKKRGYNVKVIMTKNATNIIGPITLETLSKNKVYIDMWDEKPHYEVEHIALSDWADLILIAPATYNIIGKIANGIADDMLTTVVSASKKPIFFSLAMNVKMYENPILKENIEKLKKYGYKFIDSDEGFLACGYEAKGRLKDENKIINEIERYFIYSSIENYEKILSNKNILITSGRTKEDIDPIRYLSNNSSGKMGYSLAQAAADLGARVTLISGPTNLEKPEKISNYIEISSALEMYEEVKKNIEKNDIFISCAAVADYRPEVYSTEKIKKKDGDLNIKLVRNPDILYEMGKIKENKFLVGFAAETTNIKENALKKLKNKNLDIIIANDASNMNSNKNSVEIISKNLKEVKFFDISKLELAYKILEIISHEINGEE